MRNVGEAIAAFATGIIQQRGEVAHPSGRGREEFMAESSMDHPEQINGLPLSRIRIEQAYQVLAEVADFYT